MSATPDRRSQHSSGMGQHVGTESDPRLLHRRQTDVETHASAHRHELDDAAALERLTGLSDRQDHLPSQGGEPRRLAPTIRATDEHQVARAGAGQGADTAHLQGPAAATEGGRPVEDIAKRVATENTDDDWRVRRFESLLGPDRVVDEGCEEPGFDVVLRSDRRLRVKGQ